MQVNSISCPHCGKTFTPKSKGVRFCSNACGAKARRHLPDATCQTCGKVFRPGHRSKTSFCSHACYWANMREYTDIACEHCGKMFYKGKKDRRFCSIRCGLLNRAGTTEERFMSYVRKTDGCWLWTGALNNKGYGEFNMVRSNGRRRPVAASRVSYELFVGEIPEGKWVLHRCDNPPCVRPDHLYIGTPKQNSADMVSKGRHRRPDGSHKNAKLTTAERMQIRDLCNQGILLRKEIAAMFGIVPSGVTKIAGSSR